jgi:hypothetical protein
MDPISILWALFMPLFQHAEFHMSGLGLLALLPFMLPMFGIVDATTFLADMKIIYGAIQDQVSTLPAFMNLLGDGSKFGKPVNNLGVRGYVFLARLRPNFNMGFRPEGVAGVGAGGNQGLANATVLLKYGYVPETITGQAENLSKGDARSFMQAKALEVKYDTKDLVSHMNVLSVGADRGGQIASVAAAPAPGAGTFTADAAGGFPWALYLRLGMPIDTYTVGGMAVSTCSSSIITAINYATRAVTHTLGTAIAAEAVTLGGESCIVGNYPTTMEGLVSLVNDTGAIQGLNPATAGQQSWTSFVYDVAGDDLSSYYLHALRAFVKNRGGEQPDVFIFPSAQVAKLVRFATQNYRFETNGGKPIGKKALDIGYDVFEYAGIPIIEDKDARPDRIYCGASSMMKKFEAVPLTLADDEAGTWTRIIGAGGIADAVAGLLRTYVNLGTLQRSSWGAIKNLSVDDVFWQQTGTI